MGDMRPVFYIAVKHLIIVLLAAIRDFEAPRSFDAVGQAQPTLRAGIDAGSIADVGEELLSMGLFVSTGGRVVWDSEKGCLLYVSSGSKDGSGRSYEFFASLAVERNCPLLSSEQALSLRRYMRGIPHQSCSDAFRAAQSVDTEPLSKLAISFLHRESASFGYFLDLGFFDDVQDCLNILDPVALYSLWEASSSPHKFLEDVTELFLLMCMFLAAHQLLKH